MRFNCSKRSIYAFFFLLVFMLSFPLYGKKMNVQKEKESLEEDLGILFDQVLHQNFLQPDHKDLALRLSFELDCKYDLLASQIDSEKEAKTVIKQIKMLRLLIKAERMAQAKLELLLAASGSKEYGHILCLQEWRVAKLNILKKLYDFVQDKWKKVLHNKINLKDVQKQMTDNTFITKTVIDEVSGKIGGELCKLVEVDFYGLWGSLYKRYEAFINEYRRLKKEMMEGDESTKNELENLLMDFCRQKIILADDNFAQDIKNNCYSWFWFATGENRLKQIEKIFELFIDNLIKIKNEMERFKLVSSQITSIADTKKRDILIRHLVLTNKQNFQNFSNYDEFYEYFEAYQSIVETYVNTEELDEKFVYRIKVLLSKLDELRSVIENYGFLHLIVGVAKSEKEIKRLLNDMAEILNQILNYMSCSENDSKKASSFLERLLCGDVVVSEKIQKWIWKLINSAIH